MTNSTQPLVVSELHEHAWWVTLNRAAKRNALSNPMLEELLQAVRDGIRHRDVRCIVLHGDGACFSAGRDTKELTAEARLQDQSLDDRHAMFLTVLETLMSSPKPTVAVVHGYAFGAGQAVSLACDFCVAERSTRFGNVEMVYGFPAAMNTVLLARHLGRRLGLEIAMTGEPYSAERYFEMGLVNRLAEDGALMEVAEEFVNILTARAPWAVTRTKETFRMAEDASQQMGLHLGNQLNQLLMMGSQTQSVHSGDVGSKAALKDTMKGER